VLPGHGTPNAPSCGDLDGDGVVSLADIARMTLAFGLDDSDCGFDPAADPDGDGVVSITDLALQLNAL